MHLPTAITQCVLTHAYLLPREHPCCCCQQLPELSTLQPWLLRALSSRALPRRASRVQGAQNHLPTASLLYRAVQVGVLARICCGTSSSALHHCPVRLHSCCVRAALRASEAGPGVQGWGWKGSHRAPGHLRQEIAGTCVWLVGQTH